MYHCREGIRPEFLSASYTPNEVEIVRLLEESLLRYQQPVIQAAYIVKLGFRPATQFFHSLAEILQHPKRVNENVVDYYLASLAVQNAEVHGIGIE